MNVAVLVVLMAYFRYKLQCLVLSSLSSFTLSLPFGDGDWKRVGGGGGVKHTEPRREQQM